MGYMVHIRTRQQIAEAVRRIKQKIELEGRVVHHIPYAYRYQFQAQATKPAIGSSCNDGTVEAGSTILQMMEVHDVSNCVVAVAVVGGEQPAFNSSKVQQEAKKLCKICARETIMKCGKGRTVPVILLTGAIIVLCLGIFIAFYMGRRN